jgi:hypothetical protein
MRTILMTTTSKCADQVCLVEAQSAVALGKDQSIPLRLEGSSSEIRNPTGILQGLTNFSLAPDSFGDPS